MKLDITFDLGVAYLQLTENPVSRTVEVGPSMLVDLDSLDVARGIEILDLASPISPSEVDELFKKYHVAGGDRTSVRNALTSTLQNLTRYNASSSQTQTGLDAVNAERANNVVARRLADC